MKQWWAQFALAAKQQLRSLNRKRLRRRHSARRASYAQWVGQHDTLTPEVRKALCQRLAGLNKPPLISVLLPTYNPRREWLAAAVDSVRRQIYPHWQLCLVDDASTEGDVPALLAEFAAQDARIQVRRRDSNGHICAATNTALEMAQGQWVVLLDHDDLLAEHALLLVAEASAEFAQARLIYSDEDKLGPDGQREKPYFKPDWDRELCRGQNLVCHLCAIDTALVRELGGWRLGLEGAQDHDLVLRCSERLQPTQLIHIPHVLYHWREHAASTAGDSASKPYALEAGRRAVQDHLDRLGEVASVSIVSAGRYRVHYALPDPLPSVCIVIPTRDQSHLLIKCVQSVLGLTDYPGLEVLIVDNGSQEPAALAFMASLTGQPNVRVLHDPLQPFNFSALNNRAIANTSAEFVVLMNNDIEVIDATWLREMIAQAARPHVGAVGAKLLYPDRTVQHAGVVVGVAREGVRVASPVFKGLAQHAGGQAGRALLAQSYSAVTAACLAVRRSRYLEVGGLDETHLAVAYNDVDFCLRLREAGYVNLYCPHATLLHHESVSRGRDVAAEHQERFSKEVTYMQQRWAVQLERDPAYNPNLNRDTADFALADTPAVSLLQPWYQRKTT